MAIKLYSCHRKILDWEALGGGKIDIGAEQFPSLPLFLRLRMHFKNKISFCYASKDVAFLKLDLKSGCLECYQNL